SVFHKGNPPARSIIRRGRRFASRHATERQARALRALGDLSRAPRFRLALPVPPGRRRQLRRGRVARRLLGRASQAVDLRRTHVGAQLAVWHLAPYRERVSPRHSPRHATPPPASRSGPRTIAERVWPRRGTPSDATAAREPRRAQARSFHPRRADRK